MKKTIVFTGGGSAGHVTPNIAIINEMDDSKWDIRYIGSKQGIEKELITKRNIPYYEISSGKLRRYLDAENVIDVFRVLKGCMEARRTLKKIKPELVFSKGGFVSVPVIIAARSLKIPILIHESDLTPGLANKISQRFATKIFTSFEETKQFFPQEKTTVIGSPIRKEILTGDAQKGREFLGFHDGRPVLTMMGGSLGAKKINEAVRESIHELTEKYQLVHLCGKGNRDESMANLPGYKQYEYVNEELADVLAATDYVITRGGSNAIFEFLALNIPMIIVPLTKKQSRGDQILNAKSFEEKGFAIMLEEEYLTPQTLTTQLENLRQQRETMQRTMAASKQGNGLQSILEEIEKV
ncbi:UDP-N-acetylglucosamine--N-acetylmuramyl-(pentapeptide) pyrophosphoryl-undecaprenol N-acetylglucosamine transferase [Evansella caseinilytica]|uniref:UDP-N-acetylglucosamine--N-acetylmuramyl-(pentapeptide) pyrophosphoryl-undecaprenol N-acetylglucosamine transferase n=1 Tax=Evansella caseinilytica TaxID=1503961 RepID=A0A1H3SXI2_9BACI|nr:undecaprenyldiphospho-muramoylpentapeptide beta-N-acetylglucosaminyltransferase [Evansella caseinilytica]SDZ42692.1 UDP-N-acetylglucosamine--N-acetylmuramyl-(pentapeptide) pyrophosphoryl-undecaprenol N-acetylglucosamine transferase [Evansella caseinilytica]